MESNVTNPLQERIASASATATVDVLTDRPVTPGNDIGTGGVIAFASRTSALLIATTIINASFPTAEGHGKYRIDCNCSVDDSYMATVSSLLSAEYIRVGFAKGLVPPNTEVLRGQVVWAINNRVTLKFEYRLESLPKIGLAQE
jgi:hypothetical protein